VLPAEVVATLKGLKAPVDIIPYRRMYVHYGKVPYQFEVLEFDRLMKHAQLLFLEGEAQHILPQLREGKGVLVSEVFANQTGIRVGTRFQAQLGQAHLDLPVLGVIRDYRTQGGVVYYSMPHFQKLSGDTTWSGVRFNLLGPAAIRENAAELLRTQVLRALGRYQQGVELTLGRDLREAILKIFDETFAITTVLLLIALAVAALGITSTLTVLVLDRTRHFHTILACGGTRGQIRLMVFWEALIMVFGGECLGLVCGFFLSYLLIFVINRQSFGWTFIYTIDWLPILLSSPLILATALFAALPASQIVFKLPPAMVLREQ
jgi:putative ABC transport system permease protein